MLVSGHCGGWTWREQSAGLQFLVCFQGHWLATKLFIFIASIVLVRFIDDLSCTLFDWNWESLRNPKLFNLNFERNLAYFGSVGAFEIFSNGILEVAEESAPVLALAVDL